MDLLSKYMHPIKLSSLCSNLLTKLKKKKCYQQVPCLALPVSLLTTFILMLVLFQLFMWQPHLLDKLTVLTCFFYFIFCTYTERTFSHSITTEHSLAIKMRHTHTHPLPLSSQKTQLDIHTHTREKHLVSIP